MWYSTLSLILAVGTCIGASSSLQTLQDSADIASAMNLEHLSRSHGAAFTGARSASVVPIGRSTPRISIRPKHAHDDPGRSVPRDEKERKALKNILYTGSAAAAVGAGLLIYSGVAAASLVVPGAALLFVGGLAAYLSYRRLKGKNDFPPKAH